MDIVLHPGAAAVVPFLTAPTSEDPTILLIRQYRHATGSWLLEVPAGRLDAGESPEQCARRELLEETGCTAGEIRPLTAIFTTPGFSDELIHLFLATDLRRGDARREDDEFIELTPTPLSRALEQVSTGELRDAKSVVAILFSAGFVAAR